MTREELMALADELESMDCREGCRSCPADGTKDCRGDLSCEEAVARAAARRVREIIEHDECKVTTVSAYDLLSEEDREALAWVREMGGANALSRGFQDADNRRIELCSSLGIDLETGWADAMVAMRRRLMPEGMEWPKVDGKPVDFNTFYGPSLGALEAVSIYNNGACEVMSRDGIVKDTTEIHVFKPKVLDADGVEIREGNVLYSVETGDCVIVDSIEPGNPWFVTTDGALQHCAKFTHRALVLAADGKPLREGEHVYHVETGAELVVKELPKPGEYQAVVVFALPTSPASHLTSFDPDRLTHERPDSWERLEEDKDLNPFDYCKKVGHHLDTCENAERYKSRDLVRRAKKMAGIDND